MTETGLSIAEKPSAPQVMQTAQEQRAIAEVQAKLVIAKRFPRDTAAAVARIRAACSTPGVAAKAFFSYKRGATTITGPTVDLLEVIAQNWGNIDFGVRELSQVDGSSEVQAYAWDLETNTSETRTFQVPHVRYVRDKGNVPLYDPRDIYEAVANVGARRKRACLENIIPQYVVDEATAQCKKTMLDGGGKKTFDERRRNLVAAFNSELGISPETLSQYLGHPTDEMTYDEFVGLHGVFETIKSGEMRSAEVFGGGESEKSRPTATEAIKDKFGKDAGNQGGATPPPPPTLGPGEKSPEVAQAPDGPPPATPPPVETGAQEGNNPPSEAEGEPTGRTPPPQSEGGYGAPGDNKPAYPGPRTASEAAKEPRKMRGEDQSFPRLAQYREAFRRAGEYAVDYWQENGRDIYLAETHTDVKAKMRELAAFFMPGWTGE